MKQEGQGPALRPSPGESLVVPIVVVAAVLVIPVTLVVLPAVVIVVVVRVDPIGIRIRSPTPHTRNPHLAASGPVPISIDPGITRTRNSWPNLIAQRWRWRSDINTYLSK